MIQVASLGQDWLGSSLKLYTTMGQTLLEERLSLF